jgi:type IV pilus assembly protein PilF
MTKARLGFWLGFIGLGLAGCASPQKDPNERSASELYMLKGVRYLENGQFNFAQQDLERSVKLDPKNVEAHNSLGVLYERLNQYADAEDQFKQALALDAHNGGTYNNYGRTLCAEGKYDLAMQQFHHVIDDPHYTTPWIALTNAGICTKKQGSLQDAENYLRKALDIKPDFPPTLLEMARLRLEKNGANGDLSARAFLQRFEAASEPTAESVALGMQIEQALGNTQEADVYFKKLLRLFPNSKEAMRYRSHAAPH